MSQVNTGYKMHLYYSNEADYGTIGSEGYKSIGLVQSVSPTEMNSLIKIRTLGGDRDYSNIVPGKFEVNGSFSYYIQDGKFLVYAIGEAADSVHSGTSYLHTMGEGISPGANDFPSFTLEFGNVESTDDISSNLVRKYDGCRVNTLSLNATVDEPLQASVDWIGRSVTATQTSSAGTVTISEKDPYVFYQGGMYLSDTDVEATTSMAEKTHICELNSFDISINNNLEALWYICRPDTGSARSLRALVPKGRDWEGNVEINFSNWAMYQRFLGSVGSTTPQDVLESTIIVLDFVRSGTIGGTAASTDDFMRIVLKGVKFDQNEIAGAPEDIVSQSLTLSIESAAIHVVDDIEEYDISGDS